MSIMMKQTRPGSFLVICALASSIMLTGCGHNEQTINLSYIENGSEGGTDNDNTLYYNNYIDNSVCNMGESVSDINAAAGNVTDTGSITAVSNDTSDSNDMPIDNDIIVNNDIDGDCASPEISIIMVGDILLHTRVADSGMQDDGSYNFDAVFANVKDEIAAADLAIVNQEVIIGGEELGISGYPCFNAPYELGDALAAAGFDVVLHATNHTLDKGGRGVDNCLSFWENNYPDIAVLGINGSEEAQDSIYVYEQDGLSIAILNYTYGTNGIAMPADMPYAVNLLDEKKVAEDIKKAKERADFVIVCLHWGTEYKLTPSAEQKRWTALFLENGAGLVIGTHPHVIEPIEWVSDDDGNEMLVYYSLGNFVNWTSGSGEGVANRMVGGMAEITIGRNTDGEAYISDYGVEPLVCHLEEGASGVTTYLLSEYTSQLADDNMIVRQDGGFSLEYCENLCSEVWGGLFR